MINAVFRALATSRSCWSQAGGMRGRGKRGNFPYMWWCMLSRFIIDYDFHWILQCLSVVSESSQSAERTHFEYYSKSLIAYCQYSTVLYILTCFSYLVSGILLLGDVQKRYTFVALLKSTLLEHVGILRTYIRYDTVLKWWSAFMTPAQCEREFRLVKETCATSNVLNSFHYYAIPQMNSPWNISKADIDALL